MNRDDQPGADRVDPVIRRGPLRIAQGTPLPGHCSRRILFGDGVSMQVNADLLAGGPGAGLCGIAQAGAEEAVDAIAEHKIAHRTFPPESLALTDPCKVLDSGIVQQIPGLEQARPQPAPAAHQCQWGRQDADSPRVQLVHTAGEPPRVSHGTSVEEQISGRRTVVNVVGGDPRVPLCSAETGDTPFGRGETEVAQLVVALPGESGVEACEFARGLAEQAWPHLPRA